MTGQHAARLGQHEEARRIDPGMTGGRVARPAPAAARDHERDHRQDAQPEQEQHDENAT
jgi:hypothetical protein